MAHIFPRPDGVRRRCALAWARASGRIDRHGREMCRAAEPGLGGQEGARSGARIVDERRGLHDRYLILRDRVGKERDEVALGMVGSGYEPLQNTEAFRFFEPFIEGKYARFHTAGALGNGERIWVLVKLNERIVIGNDDIVDRFLLFVQQPRREGSSLHPVHPYPRGLPEHP